MMILSNPSSHFGGASRVVVFLALIVGIAAIGIGVIPRLQSGRQLKADAQAAAHQLRRVEYVSPHLAADGETVLPANIQAVSDTPIFARAFR